MPRPKNPLPCFVCGTELDHAVPLEDGEHVHNQPSGGLALATSGHYGSTVFDPMRAGLVLEVAVCDGCMTDRWRRTRQVRRRRHTTEEVVVPTGTSYRENPDAQHRDGGD